MTESGRLCAFITKVKRGSLADTVGRLRPGELQGPGPRAQGPGSSLEDWGPGSDLLSGLPQGTRSWSGTAEFSKEQPLTRSTTSSWSPRPRPRWSWWCPGRPGGSPPPNQLLALGD